MNPRRDYDRDGDAHFVTFSCYHRRRLLDHDDAKQVVVDLLNDQLGRQRGRCVGFVIIPDHVHAIIWFPMPDQLSHFLKQWNQRSSVVIKRSFEPASPPTPQHSLGTTKSGRPDSMTSTCTPSGRSRRRSFTCIRILCGLGSSEPLVIGHGARHATTSKGGRSAWPLVGSTEAVTCLFRLGKFGQQDTVRMSKFEVRSVGRHAAIRPSTHPTRAPRTRFQ